jgi:hypothetical protein
MLLCNKHEVSILHQSYYIDIEKEFNWRGEIDYYTYNVVFYKYDGLTLFKKKKYKEVWNWETNWLDYGKYHGNIDMIINKATDYFVKNIQEQKYINNKEYDYFHKDK